MRTTVFFLALLPYLMVLASRNYEDNSSEERTLDVVEGDILTPSISEEYGGSALADANSKWSNGEVYVIFESSFMKEEKDKIIAAMSEIQDKTCVRFYYPKNHHNDIIVIKKPTWYECSSMIGRTGGRQTLRLASRCLESKKVILHELMHALGFIHEHNRSDRDKYVHIKRENIKQNELHNYDKRRFSELALMGTGYAYHSIMHYVGHEFAINNKLTTIVPKQAGVTLGGGNHLSDIDILRINKYYQCDINPKVAPVAVPLTTTQPPKVQNIDQLCLNGHEAPKENARCSRWKAKMEADMTSDRHFFQCALNQSSGNFWCGKWERKECWNTQKFDRKMKMCNWNSRF